MVVRGEVEIAADGSAGGLSGGPGMLIQFDPHERPELRARSDAWLLLLLTLAGARPPRREESGGEAPGSGASARASIARRRGHTTGTCPHTDAINGETAI